MKFLVVLCAVVAASLAKPYGYVAGPVSYSSVVSLASPYAYATPYAHSYAAPAAILPAAGVAHSYAAAPAVIPAAPAVVAAPYAAAPAVVHAAPAVVHETPAVVHAAPAVVHAAPAVVHAAPAVHAAKTQYHAQNEHGEASYGHSEPGQTHNAVQDAHGNKVGSFSYVNPDGHVLRTDYVADAEGYRVASNALPAAPIVTPIDTPEVAAAKAVFHNEYAVRAAGLLRRRRSAVLVQTPASTAPLTYAAPFYYGAQAVAPVAYSAHSTVVAAPAVAPVAYAAHPAPVAYAAHPAPVAYAAHAAPVAYAAPVAHPATRLATLTTVVNNPGHAVSYRVD